MEKLNLLKGQRVYLDSNVLIAAVEGDAKDNDVVRRSVIKAAQHFLSLVASGEIVGVTSDLTLAECLTGALARSDELAAFYRLYLSDEGPFELGSLGRAEMDQGAVLRHRLGGKLPDALHLAVLRSLGCAALISNDRELCERAKALGGFDVLYLKAAALAE